MVNEFSPVSDSPAASVTEKLMTVFEISNEDMKTLMDVFKKDNKVGNRFVQDMELTEFQQSDTSPEQSPEQQLDKYAKELADQLKGGVSTEEAQQVYADFMEKNGDAYFGAAMAIDMRDPMTVITDSLNKSLEGTEFSTRYDERAMEVYLMQNEQDIIGAAVGPTLDDILGIPQN